MYRTIAGLIVLFATSGAWAQTAYNPTVAYSQLEGRSTNLYVANADGSHVVRVAASAKGINGIDFAPGGGRIAFVEKGVGIKVLSYTASNSGIIVNNVLPLVLRSNAYGPDFSSDGSRVLYHDVDQAGIGGIYAVSAGGGTSPVLLYAGACGWQRWLRSTTFGNAFVCMKIVSAPNAASVYEIWTVLLDGNDQVLSAGPVLSTASQTFKGIEDFDTARTRDALLITANYPTTIRVVEFDLNSYAVIDKAGGTYKAHYSADDSRIVSTDLHYLGSKEYVTSINLGTSVITRLSKAGNFGSVDARP